MRASSVHQPAERYLPERRPRPPRCYKSTSVSVGVSFHRNPLLAFKHAANDTPHFGYLRSKVSRQLTAKTYHYLPLALRTKFPESRLCGNLLGTFSKRRFQGTSTPIAVNFRITDHPGALPLASPPQRHRAAHRMLCRLAGLHRIEPRLLEREIPLRRTVGIVDQHQGGIVLQTLGLLN